MGGHWWVADQWALSPVFTVSWIVWVITSITLHELGHGWMAIRCGDDYPRVSGHMTLNPLVHIPFPMAWVMFLAFGFTWGLMPINPSAFRGRYDDAKVAFAGPAMNLLQAAGCLLADVAWLTYGPTAADPLHRNVHAFLLAGLMINSMGFCFNLLPVPPLDGSRILGNFFPRFNELWRGAHGGVIGTLVFIGLFWYGSGLVWDFATRTAITAAKLGVALAGGEWRSPFH